MRSFIAAPLALAALALGAPEADLGLAPARKIVVPAGFQAEL